jgi:hypothetical protein
MKRPFPGIAFLLFASLGCSDGVEIPTVEFGGNNGARLMNGQAKTPAEAYENAYGQLSRAHYNVRRNLDARGQNLYGAREAMAQILRSLETMRAVVPAADQARFDPYLSRYAGWLKDLENGSWGGSFLIELDRIEQELKSKFNPGGVEVLAEFPKSTPPPEALMAPKAVAPAPGALTPDKVELPVVKTPAAAPAVRPKPAPAAEHPGVSSRILYKAWDRAHDDLVAAYKEKKSCKTKYEDVAESLRLLKAQLAGDKAAKLQIYIDYYGGIDEKTKGFTALPEKTAEKDIVDELDVAARVIRKEFNPEK